MAHKFHITTEANEREKEKKQAWIEAKAAAWDELVEEIKKAWPEHIGPPASFQICACIGHAALRIKSKLEKNDDESK